MNLFVVGLVMAVAGSIGINIGMNIQSIGLKRLPEDQRSKPHQSRIWTIGFLIFVSSTVLNFVAFMFAPASILVPLEAIQLVTNVIFNRFVNKVTVSWRLFFGSLLTFVGTVMVVAFGAHEEQQKGVDQILECWTFYLWWVYLGISLSVSLLCLVAYKWNLRRSARGVNVFAPNVVQPVLFAASACLSGAAQMIVHTKALSMLIFTQFSTNVTPRPLEHWLFYVEIVIMIVTGGNWLYRQNEGLGLFDPLFIIPLLQAFFILFGVIATGVFFKEFWSIQKGPIGAAGGWTCFLVGLVFIFVGLYLTAPRTEDGEAEEASTPSVQTPNDEIIERRSSEDRKLSVTYKNPLRASLATGGFRGLPGRITTHSPARRDSSDSIGSRDNVSPTNHRVGTDALKLQPRALVLHPGNLNPIVAAEVLGNSCARALTPQHVGTESFSDTQERGRPKTKALHCGPRDKVMHSSMKPAVDVILAPSRPLRKKRSTGLNEDDYRFSEDTDGIVLVTIDEFGE